MSYLCTRYFEVVITCLQCFTSQYLCFEYFRDISLSGLNVILSSTACEEKYLEVDF